MLKFFQFFCIAEHLNKVIFSANVFQELNIILQNEKKLISAKKCYKVFFLRRDHFLQQFLTRYSIESYFTVMEVNEMSTHRITHIKSTELQT